MQLVAYGAQDIYLTGQPQITFWKSVYRRYTNFAIESILQTINGTSSPGTRVSVTIARNGDLLKKLWIEYDPNSIIENSFGSNSTVSAVACDFGHALLDQLEIEIGGQLIDRQYGKWLTIWRYLTQPNTTGIQKSILNVGVFNGVEPKNDILYNRMAYTHLGSKVKLSTQNLSAAPARAYIPMQFWFCKNPGLALPLIALQYHEIKFNITFAQLNSFVFAEVGGTQPIVNFNSIQVYADYVYLDTTERRQFAQNAHEYLIDQLQIQQAPASNLNLSNITLNFNHPVKEIIYTGTPLLLNTANIATIYSTFDSTATDVNIGGATPYIITGTPNNTTKLQVPTSNLTSKIVLNGTDRFTERHITYFTRNQIWEYHTGYGSTLDGLVSSTWSFYDTVAVYSFALRPEEHQPSGTCNFSRIDTAQLVFNGATINDLDIYAVNYNVLRIMSGMGGLAYSN